ncbi:MAG: alpha/beta fold hydrolase, partial [Fulvivirga sp.]|nr:alpha/beta fold hydrolase [Fulvivirga sp.]
MPLVKSKQTQKQTSKISWFSSKEKFSLESGDSLPGLTIAYTTYGAMNAEKSNVIWIFHALTANSDPIDWWPEIVGKEKPIDTEKYFIVCANVLGSCYGTTGPSSIKPASGEPYNQNFPAITIKDMVKAHQLLQQHLSIERIYLGIGGSLGGQQLLEWAASDTHRFESIALIASNARHSAWGIAFNETQRMALEASGFNANGLETARAIAMLSYR